MKNTTDTEPHFSLVFVNYRSARHLAKALQSLFSYEKGDQNNVDFEVIVVNNDSEESAVLRGLRVAFPFTLVESEENKGYGQGINLGVKEARGTILGFLNPDILWNEKSLDFLKELFQDKKQLGVVGMSLVNHEGKREPWSTGKDMNILRLIQNNLSFSQKTPVFRQGKLLVTDWVSGGAFFVRKELFILAGGFDERFFLYFEDMDFCHRIRAMKYDVALCSSPSLIHYGGKSQVSPKEQKKFFYLSQEEYFKKYCSQLEYGTLRLLRFCRYGF